MQISVRKKTLEKLLEVYRDYCNKCSEGQMIICDQFEQIPCKIFMLFYDRDCKEFRFVYSHVIACLKKESVFTFSNEFPNIMQAAKHGAHSS